MTERLVSASESLLERRSSRRGFLARLALAGSALAVGPLRYLLRPLPAWAVINPEHCPKGSACADGYTEFCCSITGGRNQCPGGTFPAGWWKCSHFSGSGICADQGVRYYLDCNVKPGHHYPGGCRCAGGGCGQRRIACNVFRYGQCNADVGGVTPIVCRVITCVNPSTVASFNCNDSFMSDNKTCGHNAGCLDKEHARILGPSPGA